MGVRRRVVESVKKLMNQTDRIRNIGIVAHIDHGKTTMTDSLLAGAGIISYELAGEQLFMDFYELEQQRGITIFAANVSMVHEVDGNEYLINLIDTPGHVDFGGEVTRAMRAVDGVVVVVDAVEGVMPQTETVVRQALREGVRPVVFINKIDRLINELKLSKDAMKMRLAKVIDDVNNLLKSLAPERYDEWRIRPEAGNIAFGSALQKWGISVPLQKKTGIGFNEVYEYLTKGEVRELAKKSPLHVAVLDMVVRHIPNPLEAQKYKMAVIWHGDFEREKEVAEAMMKCDPKGPVVFMATKINVDPHVGEVVNGRLFSGTLRKGEMLKVSGSGKMERVQQVCIYIGPDRMEVEEIPAGNIAAVVGIKDASAGCTISSVDMTPFESLKYVSEPVVTIAIEPKNPKDLPRLVEVLREIEKEDPTVRVEIDEETGEHLVSGMGELHLEIVTYRIEHDKKMPIITSKPIVVYRESVKGTSPSFEGVSPNRHNRFYIVVEPLGKEIVQLIKSGEISRKMDELELRRKLINAGMDKEEAKNVVDIHGPNVYINMTKGVLQMREAEELIIQGFHDAMDNGPLAREKCEGIKVKLVDVKLHEDAIHRGPAQVIPAVRSAIKGAILSASPTILEPMQYVFVQVPQEWMGNVTHEISGRRGQILDITTEGNMCTVKAKAPVAEMFGFADSIRSATEGRALWTTEHAGFEEVPAAMQKDIILAIRKRKGLKTEIPTPSEYVT